MAIPSSVSASAWRAHLLWLYGYTHHQSINCQQNAKSASNSHALGRSRSRNTAPINAAVSQHGPPIPRFSTFGQNRRVSELAVESHSGELLCSIQPAQRPKSFLCDFSQFDSRASQFRVGPPRIETQSISSPPPFASKIKSSGPGFLPLFQSTNAHPLFGVNLVGF
jgi:hypothetical protein